MQSNNIMHKYLLFLKSAFSETSRFLSNDAIRDWLKQQRSAVPVRINEIPFKRMEKWRYEEQEGSYRHQSGKFFSIDGIQVKTNWGDVAEWDQPIINQPEVGYLGFITREFDGVLHFLVQAKVEPGNINHIQISPTLQATRSNFNRVHEGKKPRYLEYFQNVQPHQILLDQLQSEQGARFLRKRNRNIIIKIDADIPVYDNFTWLTLGQIKKLMRYDNCVNMDTRTVIAGIPYGRFDADIIDFFSFLEQTKDRTGRAFLRSALSDEGAVHTISEIITFITQIKSNHDLEVHKIPLSAMRGWVVSENEIRHKDNRFFKVIGVDIEIGNREVTKWCQPMVKPAQEGLCAFVCKEINGTLHFAVQAKLECGNLDVVELAPTVQCLTGNYRQTVAGTLPFLDYVVNAKQDKIVYDTMQSEEGGRFFREQNRNMIVIAGGEVGVELPPNYIWMTLNQLYTFLEFNNYLNIQARSLISAISFT